MATKIENTFERYLGNGVVTDFPVNFEYKNKAYVKVYLKRKDGTQVATSDYDWTDDKTIKFPKSSQEPILQVGDVLVIQRETPNDNPFIFENQTRLFPESVMNADDRQSFINQEQQRDIARCVKVPATETVTPEEMYQEFLDGVQSAKDNAASSENSANNSAASAVEAKGYADEAKTAVDGFDQHVEDSKGIIDQFTGMKIDDLDAHAVVIENKFNDNAAIKQAEVDESARKAKESETNAKNYATQAELSKIAAQASEAECKRIIESLGVIFVYKGTVATYNDLPLDSANGDVYRVLDQSVFYVFADGNWENLGGLIDISTLVTINTDQEIEANKTFLKDVGITSKNIDTTTDRNTRLQGLGYYDKNNLRGAVYPYVGASGNVELRFMSSTGNASSFGAIGTTADGKQYMYAPKPPADSNDDSVATTDWVNDKVLQASPDLRLATGLLTGNVSTFTDGYDDVETMNSSVVEHGYDVIESSIDTDAEGWHTGYLDAVDIDVTKQFKFSIGFKVTGFPHEQGLFNFVSEDGDPNSCLILDKNQKIKCRFTTLNQQHLEEIDYIFNPNYEYRVTWEYDKYVGYTINIYDGATLVKTQIINDTGAIDGISPRALQFGIGYNSGTKLEGQLKGDFIQAISEDKIVYVPHLAIHYKLSTYGTKIADIEYRDIVTAMYSLKGYAPYFTIDNVNRNYTVPMGNIYRGWGAPASEGGSGDLNSAVAFYQNAGTVEAKGEIVSIKGDFTDCNGKKFTVDTTKDMSGVTKLGTYLLVVGKDGSVQTILEDNFRIMSRFAGLDPTLDMMRFLPFQTPYSAAIKRVDGTVVDISSGYAIASGKFIRKEAASKYGFPLMTGDSLPEGETSFGDGECKENGCWQVWADSSDGVLGATKGISFDYIRKSEFPRSVNKIGIRAKATIDPGQVTVYKLESDGQTWTEIWKNPTSIRSNFTFFYFQIPEFSSKGIKVNITFRTYGTRTYGNIHTFFEANRGLLQENNKTAYSDSVHPDGSNLNANGRSYFSSFGMPDYTAGISVTSDFICPSNGFWVMNGQVIRQIVNDKEVSISGVGGESDGVAETIPVSKGDKLTIGTSTKVSKNMFYPVKGDK